MNFYDANKTTNLNNRLLGKEIKSGIKVKLRIDMSK
jgi:hypothetical protein